MRSTASAAGADGARRSAPTRRSQRSTATGRGSVWATSTSAPICSGQGCSPRASRCRTSPGGSRRRSASARDFCRSATTPSRRGSHAGSDGEPLDLHFQEYWVRRGGRDEVAGVRYEGAAEAVAAPGVLEAIAEADVVVVCPSNPVVSIGPILAVPGVRGAVAARRDAVAGVSGIVGGAPVAGMAERLMPAVRIDVSAAGVARSYRDFLGGWLVDDADASGIPDVEAIGIRCRATDTIMVDDDRAEAVARATLELVA